MFTCKECGTQVGWAHRENCSLGQMRFRELLDKEERYQTLREIMDSATGSLSIQVDTINHFGWEDSSSEAIRDILGILSLEVKKNEYL